jgi:hypothetical protein
VPIAEDPRGDRIFSAKLPKFWGPVSQSPVVRVRDVAICLTGQSDGDVEEYRTRPPVASPILGRNPYRYEEYDPGPFDLGRGLVIDRLSNEDADLVMNACMPRGHNFSPHRQFGQRYTFVRAYGPEEFAERPYRWDPDGLITDAFMMSRLVRDNAYSTEYAARIIDYDDGEQVVVPALTVESAHAYRLRRNRDWLDDEDAKAVRALLACWWALDDALPERCRRAAWRIEYASWLRWGDVVLPILVSGLEALLKTERGFATRQFKTRVPMLAEEAGVDGVTHDLCERIYDTRSEWVHGARVRLFAGPAEGHADGEAGPHSGEEADRFAEIRLMQDVLRAAVRRAVEDEDFRRVFGSDDAIRSRWPLA